MNRIEEGARQALAAAKAFHQEHGGHNGTLPAEKQAEFSRMVDAAEAASDQLRAMKRVEGLEDNLKLFDDKTAEVNRLNEAALPESLKGQPDKGERIRLASLAAAGKPEGLDAVAKDPTLSPKSFYTDLELGRTQKWMELTAQGMPKEELALVIGTQSKGGYWRPTYWESVIVSEWRKIEGITEVVTPMITSDGNRINIQRRQDEHPGSTPLSHSTDVSTYQVAEQGAYRSDAEPTYQRVVLDTYKYLQKELVSSEVIEDTMIDVPQEVGSFVGRWYGELMETAWTVGTGSAQPKGVFHGILTAMEVDAAASGSPTILDYHRLTTDNVRLASGNAGRSFLTNRSVWGNAVRDIGKEYLPWWGVDLTSEAG